MHSTLLFPVSKNTVETVELFFRDSERKNNAPFRHRDAVVIVQYTAKCIRLTLNAEHLWMFASSNELCSFYGRVNRTLVPLP